MNVTRAVKEGKEGYRPGFLYFQYGRYLLIASSREGSLPANLQGIWNESPDASLGQQIYHKYQYGNELLDCGKRKPGGMSSSLCLNCWKG